MARALGCDPVLVLASRKTMKESPSTLTFRAWVQNTGMTPQSSASELLVQLHPGLDSPRASAKIDSKTSRASPLPFCTGPTVTKKSPLQGRRRSAGSQSRPLCRVQGEALGASEQKELRDGSD